MSSDRGARIPAPAKSDTEREGVREPDRMAQRIWQEGEADDADPFQPREHRVCNRIGRDLVEERIVVDEERSLDRLQAGHTEDVPGARRDERECIPSVDDLLRSLLIERARMLGAVSVRLPDDMDSQPTIRKLSHVPGELYDRLARRPVARIVHREPKRHDSAGPTRLVTAAAARRRCERQQCDRRNGTDRLHRPLPSSNSRPKGRSRARPAHRDRPHDCAPKDGGWQQCFPHRCQNRRMAVASTTPFDARIPAVVPVVALAYGIALLAVHPWTAEPPIPTSYAGASTVAAVAGLMAGIGLLAAGSALWLERGHDRQAILLLLAGAAWLAPDWLGWEGGPSIVRSVAAVLAPFLPALLLDLVATVSGSRFTRLSSHAVYAATAVVSLGRALFRDPFLDPHCWTNCTANSFLVDADEGVARALDSSLARLTLVTGSLVISFAAWRAVVASPAARRKELPLLVALGLAGAAEAAYGLGLILDPAEGAQMVSFRALYIANGAALSLVALAAVWAGASARRRRSAVARLAADLEAAPAAGSLAAALARSLGDPRLDVAYPIGDRLVDGDGCPIEPEGRQATPLVRDGRTIAVLLHEPDAVLLEELQRELGSAALLAIENERLRAEVLRRLHDLRASRARIVETADAERRRLERDLHDGAQQQLLALSYDLRRAMSQADGALASVLCSGVEEVQAALEELREVAHGIYPAILSEGGLDAALSTLAESARVPVEIVGCTQQRLPPAAEAAAYAVAIEALERTGEHGLALRAARHGDTLVVDAEGRDVAPTIYLADRLGALGGTVAATPRGMRAEIPCA